MTLTFNCVAQNWPACVGMKVGSTKLIVEPIAMGGKVFEITRQTEDYCKVSEKEVA